MSDTLFESFVRAYLECALWSTGDESDSAGGLPLEESYGIEDILESSMIEIRRDCQKFYNENMRDLVSANATPEQWGHDFWLTRNRHGAGFWDRENNLYTEDARDRLTEAAHACGEQILYVGDDNFLHYG